MGLLKKAKFADKIVAAIELEKIFTIDDAKALETHPKRGENWGGRNY